MSAAAIRTAVVSTAEVTGRGGYDNDMSDDASRPTSEPAPNASTPASKQRNVSVGQILAAILLILVVVFIIENTDKVKIRIIAGPKVEAPVYVVILVAAVLGALIAALLRYRRRRHTNT